MKNRTAIITGGTRGIGKATALNLASRGYRLVLNYLSDHASANETLKQCQDITSDVCLCQGDIADRSDVRKLAETAIETFGSIDVVVNNAAMNIDKSLMQMEDSDWDRVVDTNMKGVFLVSQECVRYMQQQESGGHIINIASTTGIQGRVNGLNYCASKAGVIVMTKCLALELGPKIRANCVIPGLTHTEESERRFDLKNRLQQEIDARRIPLNRAGMPEEIAGAVAMLLSEDAPFINGQKLIVDGGEFMY